MSKDNDIKSQRDRFLAFAFAGADFLIEVDRDGKIVFSSGAAKSLTGHDGDAIQDQGYLSLFAEQDGSLLTTMRMKAKAGSKQGPYLVSMRNTKPDGHAKVFVSGFTMPGSDSFYMAVSKGDNLLRIMGFEKDKEEQEKIANAKEFETLLQKKIPELMASGKDANLTLLELDGIKDYQKKLDTNTWQSLMGQIAQAVMDSSMDGESAADLDDGKYMVLQEGAEQKTLLEKRLHEIASLYDMGEAFDIKSKTVEGDLPNLTEREATRAILYTMNQMEKEGIEGTSDDLKKSFQDYLEENTNKIKTLKNLISHQKFHIHFQPIVAMETGKTAHHEVLMRFEDHKSPFELIVLGEDAGLAPDIDISVCRQALKFADLNRKKTDIGMLAVNLSGSSIQNEAFIDLLFETLHQYPDAAKHIMFELTESSNIQQLDMVDGFIQKLRAEGHQVCLDDFGAGAASFQYLHKLHVDGVKIDGAYTKSVLTNTRDATMIRNLTQMCHELDIFVVAEMVETEEQAKYLRDIGVDKGQGWLFGKADAKLNFLTGK